MPKALTTSAVTSRDRKGREFLRRVAACYDKRRLSEDGAQCLNRSSSFDRELGLLLEKHSQPDDRFRFVKSFSIVVPDGYNHDSRFAKFRKEHGREFYSYDAGITDKHYAAKATEKLVPGRKLKCKVILINHMVSPDEILDYLKSKKKTIFISAQGLTLAYEQGKDKLPKGRSYASFDRKDAFWKDSVGDHRVPFMDVLQDGNFFLNLCDFKAPWDRPFGLLCFCDA